MHQARSECPTAEPSGLARPRPHSFCCSGLNGRCVLPHPCSKVHCLAGMRSTTVCHGEACTRERHISICMSDAFAILPSTSAWDLSTRPEVHSSVEAPSKLKELGAGKH